ncbi:MAG TPA: aerotolerance regulator BatA, partial [Balneolaceae bacterium]|nr:aerotolerance regulator BatA [Balneolaceae bacterium]
GLVTFAMKSFTVVPPTLDYRLLKNLIDELEMGIIEDGTAIGMGIATAINRLKDSNTESKVIILLTDGQNNAGEIDPVTAADLASTYNIKIYTIGAGTRGTAPYPIQDPIF